MLARSLFLLGSLLVGGFPSSGRTDDFSSRKCQGILEDWLERVRPEIDEETSIMRPDWEGLEIRLRDCPLDYYWAELWMVVDSEEEREADFGRVEYWSRFERCTKLSPERFKHHSSLKRRVGNNSSSIFRYIVEKDYMLRICPRHPQDGGSSRSQDCYSNGLSKCSGLISTSWKGPPKVSPWCRRRRDSSSLEEGFVSVDYAEEHNCTRFQISGEVQTCTPVQNYDILYITFHPVDLAVTECTPGTPSLNKSIAGRTSLIRSKENYDYSQFSGFFSYFSEGLHGGYKYCVQLELKDNPYCKQDYVLNHFEVLPTVCNNYLHVPIYLRKGGCETGILIKQKQFTSVVVIVSSVLALFCIAIAVLCLRQKSRGMFISHRRKKIGGWLFSGLSPPVPSTPSRMQFSVFLLYFPDSEVISKLHRTLKEWLQSLGILVYDLNSDEYFEEIASSSESGVESIINKPDIKVIIVDTKFDLVDQMDSEGDDPLVSGEGDDNDTLLYEDNVFDLKVSTIRHIRSNYSGNYKKISVVQYSPWKYDHAISDITPLRIVTLPNHFDVLRSWLLTDDGRKTSSPMSSLTLSIQRKFTNLNEDNN